MPLRATKPEHPGTSRTTGFDAPPRRLQYAKGFRSKCDAGSQDGCGQTQNMGTRSLARRSHIGQAAFAPARPRGFLTTDLGLTQLWYAHLALIRPQSAPALS